MIYDCFPFFNELDLLEIRLHVLAPVVDKFVLVEGTKTFQKQPKPLYFSENKERFEIFSDKIIHIVVDDFPGFFYKFRKPKPWDFSNFQKDQIVRGLRHCKPDDVIIISDLDEIPNPLKVDHFKTIAGVKVFEQRWYNFFLNCICTHTDKEVTWSVAQQNKNGLAYWRGSVMLSYRDFKSFRKSRLMRDQTRPDILVVEEGGWHWSFLGGWEKVKEKLSAWEHANEAQYAHEYLNDPAKLNEIINSGHDLFGRKSTYAFVGIDDTYPAYIRNNQQKYSHLIKF